MYVLLWLNTMAAVQMFLWRVFLFSYDIILKDDGNNINCKQSPLSFQTQ